MIKNLAGWMVFFAAVAPIGAQAVQWGEPNELDEFVDITPGRRKLPDGMPVVHSVVNARTLDSVQYFKVKDGKRSWQARLAETPWSSDFWPDEKGSIADPYNETGNGVFMLNRITWGSNRDNLVKRKSLHDTVANPATVYSVPEEKFDNMSPSEKYDMLIGDKNFTLTNQVIKMVDTLDSIDLIASFSGVCHGWSPASLTIPRPQHKVTLKSPFGRDITFYPNDIKALASFLWGKSPASNLIRFEGTKCYSGRRGNKYGRMVDPKCFNVNPSFFHLVALNQIGINGKGFVVDRKADKSVWNHPVWGYSYSYFKVSDRHISAGKTLDEAKVYMSSNTWDPYHEFRSPKTSSIVGVEMTFWYGVEDKSPDHKATNDPSMDKSDHQVMHYDLELDANDNIVGGEWREYENVDAPTVADTVDCSKPQLPGLEGAILPCENYTHPNSIWLVQPGLQAYSPGDIYVTQPWDGTGTVPDQWREAAVNYASSATIGQADPNTGKLVSLPAPQALGQVLNLLVKKSRE